MVDISNVGSLDFMAPVDGVVAFLQGVPTWEFAGGLLVLLLLFLLSFNNSSRVYLDY